MAAELLPSRRDRDGRAIPYFFWDRRVTLDELREILADPHHRERVDTLALMLPSVTQEELESFRDEVVRRLLEMAWPQDRAT